MCDQQEVFLFLLRTTGDLDPRWDRLRTVLRAREVPGASMRATAMRAARRALEIVAHRHLCAVAGPDTEFVGGAIDRLHLDGRAAEAYDALCAGFQACTDDEYVRALTDPLSALLAGHAFGPARQRLCRIVRDEVRAAHARAIAHPRPRRPSRVHFDL